MFKEALEYILKDAYVFEKRQEKKVLHKLNEVIGIALFATLGNADTWEEIEEFGLMHHELLKKYFVLENGIPQHDTIRRVFAMVPSEYFNNYRIKFNELMNTESGDKIRKILSLDGKTQRGNGTANQKPNHIVSCVDENGLCLGDTLVQDKTNEIKAIPDLIDRLNISGHIITTDAMGTQREIVKKIRKKKAHYVLALKGNQGTVHDEVKQYFDSNEFLEKCTYHKTVEKARSSVETREYWQTDDVRKITNFKKWTGLKSIIMTKNTIKKKDKIITETRYFISSTLTRLKNGI